jgi:hypothetical protein
MPKEVRYNDKLWFGKYKGKRVKSVLRDTKYVDSLLEKDMIRLDKKLSCYYESMKREKQRESEEDRYSSWDDNDDNN